MASVAEGAKAAPAEGAAPAAEGGAAESAANSALIESNWDQVVESFDDMELKEVGFDAWRSHKGESSAWGANQAQRVHLY